MHLTLLHTDKLWRVMDRSNPSTSSIFNNERSFLWLHADQLPFDLTVRSPWIALLLPPNRASRSVSKCARSSVWACAHSKTVFLSADVNMRVCMRHETRTNVFVHEGGSWWMGQANNFVCGILKTIATKTAETSTDDKRNEQRTSRTQVHKVQRVFVFMLRVRAWNDSGRTDACTRGILNLEFLRKRRL